MLLVRTLPVSPMITPVPPLHGLPQRPPSTPAVSVLSGRAALSLLTQLRPTLAYRTRQLSPRPKQRPSALRQKGSRRIYITWALLHPGHRPTLLVKSWNRLRALGALTPKRAVKSTHTRRASADGQQCLVRSPKNLPQQVPDRPLWVSALDRLLTDRCPLASVLSPRTSLPSRTAIHLMVLGE